MHGILEMTEEFVKSYHDKVYDFVKIVQDFMNNIKLARKVSNLHHVDVIGIYEFYCRIMGICSWKFILDRICTVCDLDIIFEYVKPVKYEKDSSEYDDLVSSLVKLTNTSDKFNTLRILLNYRTQNIEYLRDINKCDKDDVKRIVSTLNQYYNRYVNGRILSRLIIAFLYYTNLCVVIYYCSKAHCM